MKWEYRNGPHSKLPPEVVGAELDRIWAKHGNRLQPDNVVEEARPKGAVLHNDITWDDKACGVRWRLHEARQLIRSVIVIPAEGRPPRQAYEKVKLDKEHSPNRREREFYQHQAVLLERTDEYLAALALSKRNLDSAAEAFATLQALAPEHNGDINLHKIRLILESLTTARHLAERLQ